MTRKMDFIVKALTGLSICALACAAPSGVLADPKPAAQPLAVDDVSWLFPAPLSAAELRDNTISIADLVSVDPGDSTKRDAILPQKTFDHFASIVQSSASEIAGKRVHLPTTDLKNWRIAGLRIDPGAPGLSAAIRGQFGQTPQLRFILQPVTVKPDGSVEIHDVAVHLIYNFTVGGLAGLAFPKQLGCLPPSKPDMTAFQALARDFRGLRDRLAAGEFGGQAVSTSGALLGVHPGLANAATVKPLRAALIEVLQKHLSAKRFSGLAVAGLPAGDAGAPSGAVNAPQPWIFMATAEFPLLGLSALRAPTLDGREFAEELALTTGKPATPHEVVPTPATNNENPITCRSAAALGGEALLPESKRKGVSTAELFKLGDNELSSTDAKNRAVVKEVADRIANVDQSHFFNTDCVSCHTDTRRTLDLLGKDTVIPGVDPKALPGTTWNIRNFGWSFAPKGETPTIRATATRRAASETKAVVDFINSRGLAR